MSAHAGHSPPSPYDAVPMVQAAPPASMQERAFTYRFDDHLGAPDAIQPSPEAAVTARRPVEPSGPYSPPADVPMSYAQ